MPDYKLVACEQDGSVLTITLNNPDTLTPPESRLEPPKTS